MVGIAVFDTPHNYYNCKTNERPVILQNKNYKLLPNKHASNNNKLKSNKSTPV